MVVGGTSVSAQALAGLVNNAATRAGSFAASSSAELTTIYANKTYATDFTDIKTGFCGYYMGYRVPIEKIRENDWSLAAGRYKLYPVPRALWASEN
jgi:hypothetical protein